MAADKISVFLSMQSGISRDTFHWGGGVLTILSITPTKKEKKFTENTMTEEMLYKHTAETRIRQPTKNESHTLWYRSVQIHASQSVGKITNRN